MMQSSKSDLHSPFEGEKKRKSSKKHSVTRSGRIKNPSRDTKSKNSTHKKLSEGDKILMEFFPPNPNKGIKTPRSLPEITSQSQRKYLSKLRSKQRKEDSSSKMQAQSLSAISSYVTKGISAHLQPLVSDSATAFLSRMLTTFVSVYDASSYLGVFSALISFIDANGITKKPILQFVAESLYHFLPVAEADVSLHKTLLDYTEILKNFVALPQSHFEEFLATIRAGFDNFEVAQSTPVFGKFLNLARVTTCCSLFSNSTISVNIQQMCNISDRFVRENSYGSTTFIYHLLDFTTFVLDRGYQYATTDLSLTQCFVHCSDSYAQFALNVARLEKFSNNKHYGETTETMMNFYEFAKLLSDTREEAIFINTKLSSLKSPSLFAFRDASKRLDAIASVHEHSAILTRERPTPLCVCIEGDARIGKTMIAEITRRAINDASGRNNDPVFVYNVTGSAKFMDGFDSCQHTIVFDDLAQFKKDIDGHSDALLLLRICNDVAFCTPQAHLDNKGKTFCLADTVIATTNVGSDAASKLMNGGDLKADEIFNAPAAARGRFPIRVKATVKREFREAGSTALSKDRDPEEHDLWNITVLRVVVKGSKEVQYEIVNHLENGIQVPLQDISIHAYTRWLMKYTKEFRKKTSDAKAAFKKMNTTSPFCECGFRQLDHAGIDCPFILADPQPMHAQADASDSIRKFADYMYDDPIVITRGYHPPPYSAKFWQYFTAFLALLLGFVTFLLSNRLTRSFYDSLSKYYEAELRRKFRRELRDLRILASVERRLQNLESLTSQISINYLWFRGKFWGYTVLTKEAAKDIGKKVNSKIRLQLGIPNWIQSLDILKILVPSLVGVFFVWSKYTKTEKKTPHRAQGQTTSADPSTFVSKSDGQWQLNYQKFESRNLDLVDSIQRKVVAPFSSVSQATESMWKRTVRIEVCTTKRVKAHAFAVKGCWYVAPLHVFDFFKGNHEIAKIKVIDSTTSHINASREVVVCRSDLIVHPSIDVCLIRLPGHNFSDITDKFLPESYASMSSHVTLLHLDPDGKRTPFTSTLESIHSSYRSADKLIEFVGGKYDIKTSLGWCGAPLLVPISAKNKRAAIYGIHICGSEGTHCGLFVSYKDINHMTAFIPHFVTPVTAKLNAPPKEISPKSSLMSVAAGTGLMVCTLGAYFVPKYQSDVKHRKAFPPPKELVQDIPEYKAPLLYRKKVDGIYHDPLAIGVSQMLNGKFLIPRDDIQVCAFAYCADLEEMNFSNILKPLSWSQTVNGIDGYPFIDAMKRTTSAGYGFSGRKCDHMTFDADTETWELNSDILEATLELEADYLLNRAGGQVFKACLKDEPVKAKKEFKTRVFCACPFELTLLVRKYWLPIISFIQCNRFIFECAVGVNVASPDWTNMYKWLTQHGEDRMIAGDYQKFDKTMSGDMIMAAFEILLWVARKANFSPQSITVMRSMVMDIAYPKVVAGAEIVQTFGTNPSGHPLTVILNSLVNSLYIRLAYQRRGLPLLDFRKNVALLTYGDDNIMGVNPKINFSHHDIQVELASLGVVYTTADKDETRVETWVHIKDCEFLKRSWFLEKDTDFYRAPLSGNSIYKMLTTYVQSPVLSEVEQLLEALRSANDEVWHYPNSSRPILLEYLTTVACMHDLSWEPLSMEEITNRHLKRSFAHTNLEAIPRL